METDDLKVSTDAMDLLDRYDDLYEEIIREKISKLNFYVIKLFKLKTQNYLITIFISGSLSFNNVSIFSLILSINSFCV